MLLQSIRNRIYEVRGQRVMLDYDLAELYEVETRVLNQSVKRNINRFPYRFMFQLTNDEWQSMSSQFVMTYPTKRPKSALPLAFTEHGVTMLASVLRSDKAIKMNIAIVDAFISLKEFATNYNEIANKLLELERKYDRSFKDIYEAINYLLNKDMLESEHKHRKRIGFKSSKENN